MSYHTFNGIRHKVEVVGGLDGVCDRPDLDDPKKPPVMLVMDGNTMRALHSQMHEALEASHFCDSCLHDKEGYPRTWDVARFLWRRGWRKVGEKDRG